MWRLRGIVGHGGPGGSTGRCNKYFFDWLTDPVKNGGGALMDFGCYNALWSLWYLGKPGNGVRAREPTCGRRPFPKVEDNATMILSYKNGVGMFEGSWDLPRELPGSGGFRPAGQPVHANGKVELRKGRGSREKLPLKPLPPERAEPIAYMIHSHRDRRSRSKGWTAIDINVDVIEIIEAAKESVKTGKRCR